MRAQKRTLVSTPSDKSLSYATEDSQIEGSCGLFLPNQSHRRFTRKNMNTSTEKSKSRATTQQNQNQTFSSIKKNEQKFSKDKLSSSFVRLTTQLGDSRVNKTLHQTDLNQLKGGSFKIQRNRIGRGSKLEQTIRISQQKNTSRYSGKSIDSIASKCGGKSNNIAVLRTQLQLKQKQLMQLEDERRRFRNNIQDLKRKQILLQQQLNKMQGQMKKIKQSSRQNLDKMEKKLEQEASIRKRVEDEGQKLKKELFQTNKQKKIIQKQLNIFITKQVPKNIRDLQSCRQISLQQTINELKEELSRNKTDLEKDMETIIQNLMVQNIELKSEVKALEIKNRLYQKRSVDSQRYLQAYTAVKQEYKTVRNALKEANKECELLRNENVKIKKQLKKLTTPTIVGTKQLDRKLSESIVKLAKDLSRNESQHSLNLSVSTCSR